MALKMHTASCHCGAVSIDAEFDLMAGTGRCNCSLCRKSRWWGVNLKPEAVKAVRGEENTFAYRFNTKSIDVLLCKTCGLRVFGRGDIPQIGGAFVAINIACLDTASDEELAAAPVRYSNGRDNDWMHTPAVTSYL